MKKISTWLMTSLLLVVSCNKQDAPASHEDTQESETVILKRTCASYEVLQNNLTKDLGLKARMMKLEAFTEKVLKNPGAYRLINGLIEIPVVVHVVYNTSAQKISAGQVQSQIDVLNKDFNYENADRRKIRAEFLGVASTGMNVHFTLDTTIFTSTKKKSFSTNDGVKYKSQGGADAFNPKENLNIWVCNLSNGILGYAQFPGGSAATDGVVINYKAFGSSDLYPTGTYNKPYDLGRTATHEVGHWLNLRHIWGDDNGACSGSDEVNDTPNQGNENYGTPTFPQFSCPNEPNGDMFMNYMDYTDDRSMYMFSLKQAERMKVLLTTGSRNIFSAP
jgi:hypothetical protein